MSYQGRSVSPNAGRDSTAYSTDQSEESDSYEQYESDDDGMEGVIKLGNDVQTMSYKFLDREFSEKINLPEIIVCGTQSTGKTSVLENIAQEVFLPRGLGTQTRCPIIIRLVHHEDEETCVEFEVTGMRYTDMNEVMKELQNLNQRIVNSNRMISKTPFTLTLHSRNVPDLTLVDLPGLIENPVENQPPSLVAEIDDLVKSYISKPNSIILAISDATTDIQASKSIRIAKEADPERKRTIGVLTKLDRLEEYSLAHDVLLGRKIKIEMGIIGVINRSLKDTKDLKTFGDIRRNEEAFLRRHFPDIAKQNGTAFLTKRISQILKLRICENLPRIKNLLLPQIQKLEEKIERYGKGIENVDYQKALRERITDFCSRYAAQINGKKRKLNVDTPHAHVKINKVFDKELGDILQEHLDLSELSTNQIENAIVNATGLHNRRADHEDAVQELTMREIEKLKPVVKKCNKEVKRELLEAIVTSSDAQERQFYPKLYEEIKQKTETLINLRYKMSQAYLNDYMDSECALARGGHIEDMIKERVAGFNWEDKFDADSEGEVEDVKPGWEPLPPHLKPLVKDVRREVDKCLKRVKVSILEHVPKGISFKLVYGVGDNIMNYMLEELYRPEDPAFINKIMQPVDRFKKERIAAKQQLKELKRAVEFIETTLPIVKELQQLKL